MAVPLELNLPRTNLAVLEKGPFPEFILAALGPGTGAAFCIVYCIREWWLALGKKNKKQNKSASVLIHESRGLLYIKPECPQQRGAAAARGAGAHCSCRSSSLLAQLDIKVAH